MEKNYSSSSYEESELNDEEKEKISKKIFENALDTFQKKQFKKTLTYINTVQLELNKNYYWKILILKLTCYQEIIEKKLLRDYDKYRLLIKVQKYFSLFNKETQNFFKDLKGNDDSPDYLNKCECIISLILRQCYNYSQFCIHQNFLFDAIAFLSLGERLIRNTSEFFISPESDYYATCILLFLSSLFIISDNFGTAKKYLIICLKLSYKELELRLDVNNNLSLVNMNNFNESEQEKINKIFFNISICFYHLGVCKENEYEFHEAYEAYKQAKYFGHLNENELAIDFVLCLNNMEKREYLRLQLIEFFKAEEKKYKTDESPKKVQKPKIWYDESLKKYNKLEEYIEKLNLREIDDDDPELLNKIKGKGYSKRVGIPTKTIHILNYLMDEKFKNVIDKMKKIDYNYLSKKTKDIINKQILKIKNEERVKLAKVQKEKEKENKIDNDNLKQTNINSNNNSVKEINDINNIILENQDGNQSSLLKTNLDLGKITIQFKEENTNKKINQDVTEILEQKKKTKKLNLKTGAHKKNSFSHNYLNNNIYIQTASSQFYNSTSYESKDDIKTNLIYQRNKISNRTSIICSNRSKTSSKFENLKKNNIEKIKYDYYTFSRNFKAKKKYLENQFNRELNFQKKLLKCKSEENDFYKNEDFDERKVKNKCEEFFFKTLNEEKKNLLANEEDKNKKDEKRNHLFRMSKMIGRLLKNKKQTIIVKDINKKQIDKLTDEIHEIDNIKECLLSSYKRNLNKKYENKYDL